MRRLSVPLLAVTLAFSALPGQGRQPLVEVGSRIVAGTGLGSGTAGASGARVAAPVQRTSVGGGRVPAPSAAAPAVAAGRSAGIPDPRTAARRPSELAPPATLRTTARRAATVAASPAPASVPGTRPGSRDRDPGPLPTGIPVPPPPVPVPGSTTPPSYGPVDGVVRAQGTQLVLNGAPYTFSGVNAYQLATYWPVNTGCGQQSQDLDAVFSSLAPNSMVRVWAFQALATNRVSGLRDWTGIDRVVQAAERNDQRLVLVLSNQSGTCDDGHWHDQSWYDGGYTRRHTENRVLPVSFKAYVDEVVTRYRDSAALGMWELVNEPEAANCADGAVGGACYRSRVCPEAADASLRHFFDVMGGRVHDLDPTHLLAAGTIGGGQCGFGGDAWAYVHASPALDVLTYHDYGRDTEAMPGGLAQRLDGARSLDKPLVVEEVGVRAGNDEGCRSLDARRDLLAAKQDAARQDGASGWMLWNLGRNDGSGCTYDLTAGEPAAGLVAR